MPRHSWEPFPHAGCVSPTGDILGLVEFMNHLPAPHPTRLLYVLFKNLDSNLLCQIVIETQKGVLVKSPACLGKIPVKGHVTSLFLGRVGNTFFRICLSASRRARALPLGLCQ